MGAAIQGAVLSGDVKDVLLLDVTPLSLGIETMGGVMTKLIEKNTTIPTKANQVFSTAEDNQTAVTIHVLQGEREQASANKSLGRFDLSNIPSAPRGTPQIEVTFDIDANGILNVSAKDKATGKAQSIVIKASSGLSEEEIKNMVNDAAAHSEEDKKFKELVGVRNQADSMIHNAEKSMHDLAGEMSDEEKAAIQQSIDALKAELKGNDKDAIEQKLKTLTEASGKMAERVYAKKAQQEGSQPGQESTHDANAHRDAGKKTDDSVVDAEFEEMKKEDDK